MAKRTEFPEVKTDRDVMVTFRLKTKFQRAALRKLRGHGLFVAIDVSGKIGVNLGTVEAVTVIESLGDDAARAEKRGREKAKGRALGRVTGRADAPARMPAAEMRKRFERTIASFKATGEVFRKTTVVERAGIAISSANRLLLGAVERGEVEKVSFGKYVAKGEA